MKIGNIEVTPTSERIERLSMLVWGMPSAGKTVLMSTMPGRKLWLLFDPQGVASLVRSDDVLVADFTGLEATSYSSFKQGGMYEKDIQKLLRESDVESVVVDSLTSFHQGAILYAVKTGKAGKEATYEQPSQAGYGVANAVMMDFCNMVLRTCAEARKHVAFVCHERPTMNKDGVLTAMSPSLGGVVQSILPLKISEVWRMEDTGKQRNIYIRNHGMWRPMRTRMFATPMGQTVFRLTYDQDTNTGDGIRDWYAAWRDNGFNKIPVPA